MKHLLLTTIAAVLLVGCGNPEADKELFIAADDGNIELVKKRLARGVPVNAKIDPHGETALHIAANRRNKEVVKLLIAEGADVNAMNEDDYTPLDNNPMPWIEDLLRKHGGKTAAELKAEGK